MQKISSKNNSGTKFLHHFHYFLAFPYAHLSSLTLGSKSMSSIYSSFYHITHDFTSLHTSKSSNASLHYGDQEL